MRKIFILLILIPFLVVNSVTAAPTAGSLINGGFETNDPPSSWNYSSEHFSQSTTSARNGLACLNASDFDDGEYFYQVIEPIEPNLAVTFSIYAYLTIGPINWAMNLRIEWLNGENTVLSTTNSGTSVVYWLDYFQYSQSSTDTNGAVKVRVTVSVHFIARYMDNERLTPVLSEQSVVVPSRTILFDDAELTGTALSEFSTSKLIIIPAFFMITLGLIIKIKRY